MKSKIAFIVLSSMSVLGISLAEGIDRTVDNGFSFSSPAAAVAYKTSGDMSVSADSSLVAKSFLNGDPVLMARTGGCTVSCTGGCTVSCTTSCTVTCTSRCSD